MWFSFCPNTTPREVCEASVEIWNGRDQFGTLRTCAIDFFFQSVKSNLIVWIPIKIYIFSKDFEHWGGYGSEVINESSIIPSMSKKMPNLVLWLWWRKFWDDFYLGRIYLDTYIWNMMTRTIPYVINILHFLWLRAKFVSWHLIIIFSKLSSASA